MKALKFLLLTVLALAFTDVSAQADKWPALREVQTVMAQTFDAAKSGNLQPIKTRSEELMAKSAALLKSDIPADLRTNAILGAAEKLQMRSKALHKMVQAQAPDADITQSLTDLNILLQEIVKLAK